MYTTASAPRDRGRYGRLLGLSLLAAAWALPPVRAQEFRLGDAPAVLPPNAALVPRFDAICRRAGYALPLICTPEWLLED